MTTEKPATETTESTPATSADMKSLFLKLSAGGGASALGLGGLLWQMWASHVAQLETLQTALVGSADTPGLTTRVAALEEDAEGTAAIICLVAASDCLTIPACAAMGVAPKQGCKEP